ncbi:hypothetical protein DDE19_28345 [Micromonospora ureilytica]|uniref:Uncharacterized protein n=1 Tax=Micromonospora ureilytica TaxID=709868 RepID=A0A3N9XHL8_9ACTN|nr:hypothetical protein [Micromonospora ureilytica]RQX12389.1 hypothetical protein DDE19_28345 [Micromonospora ureilytica]
MTGVDDGGRRIDGDCNSAQVLPSRRWARVVSGLAVAVVAALVFTVLFWGLRDWLVDQGRLGLPILLAVRVACFAAIGWGCWRAYQGFRRP